MTTRQVLTIIGISAVTAVASVWVAGKFSKRSSIDFYQNSGNLPANYAYFTQDNRVQGGGNPVDFTAAATAATPAVVHIKTRISARTVTGPSRSPFADLFGDDFFDDFFGGGSQRQRRIPEQRASGSGVIVTGDGYIVTNNHVIENADDISVTLPNKKSYKAELVGADPSSDLAVLKISGDNLPHLIWGNSDDVKLGQWVLAIGYPWSLDVTVTAGIVSAKARSLGLNRQKSDSPIESFIQTDAAVNQGNSGGALVDTDGRLIGINSAIASQTGSYAGYSYAIPVNLVKKIVGDLIKFGTVQRAFLGLKYIPDNAPEEQFRSEGAKQGDGVYVTEVTPGGAAEQAGVRKGDYITEINGVSVNSGSEMVEQVANYRPGDKITIKYRRDGKAMSGTATLKNSAGNTDPVTAKTPSGNSMQSRLGGEFATVTRQQAQQWGIPGGVQVKRIGSGLLSTTRMQEEYVITSVNGQAVRSTEDLWKILENAKGTVEFLGIYPGYEGTYPYRLNLNAQPNNRFRDQEP